jgi:hypothetical protein
MFKGLERRGPAWTGWEEIGGFRNGKVYFMFIINYHSGK